MKYEIGTCLATRDGMKVGNAVVVNHFEEDGLYVIRTDFGNKLRLNMSEVDSLFMKRDFLELGALGIEGGEDYLNTRNEIQAALLSSEDYGIFKKDTEK